jgi:hypothetical protein
MSTGGPRPGAGPKRKLKSPQRILFNVEKEILERLHALADAASEVIKEENARVQVRSRDRLLPYSELVRMAVDVWLDRHENDPETVARWLRPYLGTPKPARSRSPGVRDEASDGSVGLIFDERTLTGVLFERGTKMRIYALVDRVNVVIRDVNRRAEFKKDYDPEANASELIREAINAVLVSYEGDAKQLAFDMRPFLGRNKA